MPATFSWVQYNGSSGAQATNWNASSLNATASSNSMSWDFETADSLGTTSFTANPVSAGSNSCPVWLKGYWTHSTNFTVSNLKFWQFNPAASSAATASFTIWGQTQNSYSYASGTASHTNWASNVSVATNAANSTASPAGALSGTGFGSFATAGAGSGVNGTGASGSNTPGGWLALQMSAAAAAPAGTTGYFGFTLQYDEQ